MDGWSWTAYTYDERAFSLLDTCALPLYLAIYTFVIEFRLCTGKRKLIWTERKSKFPLVRPRFEPDIWGSHLRQNDLHSGGMRAHIIPNGLNLENLEIYTTCSHDERAIQQLESPPRIGSRLAVDVNSHSELHLESKELDFHHKKHSRYVLIW